MKAAVELTNLNRLDFDVDATATPTNVVKLNSQRLFHDLPTIMTVMTPSALKATNFFLSNLSANTTDIWTIPSGDYAIASIFAGTTNTSGCLSYVLVKTNGAYFYLSKSLAGLSTNNYSNIGSSSYIFEENETVAMTNTTIGMNARAIVLYWSKASFPLKVVKQFGTIAGATNTFYICPSGVRAYSCVPLFTTSWPTYSGSGPVLFAQNNSGLTMTFYGFLVPSGNSPGFGTLSQSVPIGATAFANQFSTPVLYPGDSISFSVDKTSADSVVWLDAMEVPYSP